MQSGPPAKNGALGQACRYVVHGVTVETCCGNPDLSHAVGLVLTYFGVTLDPVFKTKEPNGCPSLPRRDIRLTLLEACQPARLPEGAVPAYNRNGIELWTTGRVLHLREGQSSAEIDPGRGSAMIVIASEPVRDADGGESGHPEGSGLLRLGFVNLVLQAVLLLLIRRGFFPLHAAALGRPSKDAREERIPGVLLAAQSDSGKSTLALGLVHAGWGFLSDDSLLLRSASDSDGAKLIEALPLRREFGLDEDAACDFPEITRHWQPFLTEERKRRVDMRSLYPGQGLMRCAPRLMLFPEIAPIERSRLEPMRSSEALLTLISQSPLLGASREDASAHLSALRTLTLQAPAFRLYAGRDLKDSPELLDDMITPLLSRDTKSRSGDSAARPL